MIGRCIAAGASVAVAVLIVLLYGRIEAVWVGAVALLFLSWFVYQRCWLLFRPSHVDDGFDALTEERPSPLLKRESAVSLWQGVPVGYRQNGKPLVFRGQDTSLLIAGEPRSGKTVLLNNIIAAAALDPRVRMALFDGKGANTFRRWRQIADKVDRTGSAGALLTYLTSVLTEIERRYDALDQLDAEKVSQEIYETSMPLYLIVIDELANYTLPFPNKKLGQGVVSALAQIAAKGPAAGVVLVMATQHPSTDVVPSIIRNNVSMRVAFRVATPQASNIVLGQGMAKRGFDASTILRGEERGVAFAYLDGHHPRKVRAYKLVYEDTLPISQRALEIRNAAPLQEIPFAPPEYIGEDDAVPSRSLVDDIRAIWQDEERLHMVVILERLQRLDAAYYGPWSQQLLGRRIRDVGLAKYKMQFTEGDRVKNWGLPRIALDVALEPDDGTTPAERRREREEMAMDALDDVGLLAYQARLAEIETATQCDYCDAALGPDDPPTVDHWQPLSKSGSTGVPANLFNAPTNLFAACRSCNSSKRDNEPIRWLKMRRMAS